jgi:CheY-like chemotaxis protein
LRVRVGMEVDAPSMPALDTVAEAPVRKGSPACVPAPVAPAANAFTVHAGSLTLPAAVGGVLRVLLVEPDASERQSASVLLTSCGYGVLSVASLAEAVVALQVPETSQPRATAATGLGCATAAAEAPADVLLVDYHALCTGCEAGPLLGCGLPLVLMARALSAGEVMRSDGDGGVGEEQPAAGGGGLDPAAVMHGVELGAADFLEKPLAPLKLRTLWQHKVRVWLVS